ncbi:MAG: AraC family transcriptional regulator [Firmicutes bacterium]|nr:AraC family transcriptional regulator [Bacillota bacterium]
MKENTAMPPLLSREKYIGSGVVLVSRKRTLLQDFATHTHDFFEIECILSGHGTHMLNGESYDMRPGSIYLLTPTDVHSVQVLEPLEYYSVMFSEELFGGSSLGDRLLGCGGHHMELSCQEQTRLHPLFALLAEESAARSELSLTFLQSLMQCILITLLRKLSTSEDQKHLQGIRGALLYIHRHFREELTLEDAAVAVQLSPHYFSELFRKTIGRNFTDYVSSLRAQYAHNLLVSNEMSITDICYASGFGSFASFSRAFQKEYHMTPRQVRRKGKLMDEC